MTTPRDAFLDRVRQAVRAGNRAGAVPPLPERGHIGYQGAGSDPIACLRDALIAAGGQFHAVADTSEALAVIADLVRAKNAGKVLVGDGDILESLDLERALIGIEVIRVRSLDEANERSRFFSADIGISGVDHVIAETGTIVLGTRRNQPRSLSLLVPIHIAIARREQILPDLFDLFQGGELPACLSLITGPSKTGDIELRLVTGVHGPGEVHLVLVRG
jgi:L-lactate utilization protein LutC